MNEALNTAVPIKGHSPFSGYYRKLEKYSKEILLGCSVLALLGVSVVALEPSYTEMVTRHNLPKRQAAYLQEKEKDPEETRKFIAQVEALSAQGEVTGQMYQKVKKKGYVFFVEKNETIGVVSNVENGVRYRGYHSEYYRAIAFAPNRVERSPISSLSTSVHEMRHAEQKFNDYTFIKPKYNQKYSLYGSSEHDRGRLEADARAMEFAALVNDKKNNMDYHFAINKRLHEVEQRHVDDILYDAKELTPEKAYSRAYDNWWRNKDTIQYYDVSEETAAPYAAFKSEADEIDYIRKQQISLFIGIAPDTSFIEYSLYDPRPAQDNLNIMMDKVLEHPMMGDVLKRVEGEGIQLKASFMENGFMQPDENNPGVYLINTKALLVEGGTPFRLMHEILKLDPAKPSSGNDIKDDMFLRTKALGAAYELFDTYDLIRHQTGRVSGLSHEAISKVYYTEGVRDDAFFERLVTEEHERLNKNEIVAEVSGPLAVHSEKGDISRLSGRSPLAKHGGESFSNNKDNVIQIKPKPIGPAQGSGGGAR